MLAVQTWRVPPPSPKKISDESLSFWDRLRKASEWAGVPCSPTDVADELGVRPSAVTKYVNGNFPKKHNLNQLAVRRKVRSEWLLSGQGDMVAEEALDEETQELLRLFRTLPDDAKQRLLANARYELNAATSVTTSKREILTEELIKLLASQQRRDQ